MKETDQCLVGMITKKFTFEKQQCLYHNKVTLSLTSVQRLGNQTRSCKMDCCTEAKLQNLSVKF